MYLKKNCTAVSLFHSYGQRCDIQLYNVHFIKIEFRNFLFSGISSNVSLLATCYQIYMQRCSSPVSGPQVLQTQMLTTLRGAQVVIKAPAEHWYFLKMCTHQKLCCVHAKIEACVSTMETPIYHLARQPFIARLAWPQLAPAPLAAHRRVALNLQA